MRGLVEASLCAVVPTGHPSGTIATVAAGLVEFSATLSWKRDADVPSSPTLPALPETVRCSVVEKGGPGRREIKGEILGLYERDLGSALETILRSLTNTAAISDALLETSAARVTPPSSPSAATLQALALDLWNAGFCVRFAPSWTPVPEGAIGLGVSGAEEELRRFLQANPSWEIA